MKYFKCFAVTFLFFLSQAQGSPIIKESSSKQSFHQQLDPHKYRTDSVTPITDCFTAFSKKRRFFPSITSLLIGEDHNEYDLIKAILRDDLSTVTYLIVTGLADVNLRDRVILFGKNRKSNWTPLMYAIDKGNLEIAKFLIEFGANINSKISYNTTPLLIAAKNNDIEAIKFLLESPQLEVNAQNRIGKTALMLTDDIQIARLLIDAGADIHLRDKSNWTALMYALENYSGFFILADYATEISFKGFTQFLENPDNDSTIEDYPEMAKLLEASGTKLTPEDIDAIRVAISLRSKPFF